MSRSISMSLMALVFFSVVLAAHSYVAWRLAATLELSRAATVGIAGAFATMALLAPVIMIYARLYLHMAQARPLLWIAYLWLGFFFLLFSLTLAIDLGAAVFFAASRMLGLDAPMDPSRRLHGWRIARAVQLGAAALGVWHSVWTARRGPVVERVTVTLQRLPKALDGFTIAQISDLHVAALLRRAYVEEVVRRCVALSPSLIAVTGDLVDGSVAELEDHVAPLAGLVAPHGCFFITGNHEYYSGVDPWLAHVQKLGMRPLRNERVTIGSPEASFDLAGIDDWTAHHFGEGHGADLPRALAGRDETRELVLLAHQPKAVHEAARLGVGLMLCGHTHGGQIFPFGFLVRLAQPFVRGLHSLGQTQIYVNRGTGFWGPPMRLGSDPEITLITLRAPH